MSDAVSGPPADDPTTRHVTSVVAWDRRPGMEIWEARCACGWTWFWRGTEREACTDADHHRAVRGTS